MSEIVKYCVSICSIYTWYAYQYFQVYICLIILTNNEPGHWRINCSQWKYAPSYFIVIIWLTISRFVWCNETYLQFFHWYQGNHNAIVPVLLKYLRDMWTISLHLTHIEHGEQRTLCIFHDDVVNWKHFPRYWPFVWGPQWIPHTKASDA